MFRGREYISDIRPVSFYQRDRKVVKSGGGKESLRRSVRARSVGTCPARGVWGHAPPKKFAKFGALRAILGRFETKQLLFYKHLNFKH